MEWFLVGRLEFFWFPVGDWCLVSRCRQLAVHTKILATGLRKIQVDLAAVGTAGNGQASAVTCGHPSQQPRSSSNEALFMIYCVRCIVGRILYTHTVAN